MDDRIKLLALISAKKVDKHTLKMERRIYLDKTEPFGVLSLFLDRQIMMDGRKNRKKGRGKLPAQQTS